jgi:hypothetical protein
MSAFLLFQFCFEGIDFLLLFLSDRIRILINAFIVGESGTASANLAREKCRQEI